MISVDDALARILERAPRTPAESVPLDDAPGRVLAEPVRARADDPPFDKAAVDGYAVDAATLVTLPAAVDCAGAVHAGDPPPARLDGRVLKVMTGAPLPADCAAMVMVEDSAPEGGRIRLLRRVEPGAGVLERGENFRAGAEILPAAVRLTPAALGAAAHAGAGALECAARPRVTLIPTGDELVAPGETPGPGRIVNSSAPALAALLALAGAAVRRAPICPDRPEALRAALEDGSGAFVFTGGVSMGDADHLPRIAGEAGFEIIFHKVAMKPGKPLLFAVHPDGRTLFGLPGNPVSSFLCARLFIVPWLRARLGLEPAPARSARLARPLRGAGPRRNFLPVRVEEDAGGMRLLPLPGRGSADLAAWAGADGAAWVGEGVAQLEAGSEAGWLPLDPWH